MSSIGSGPLGIPPLINSTAGTNAQQKSAETNRTNHDNSVQKFQLDRADQLEKTIGDIGESDSTDDRDADGRMPWVIRRRQVSDENPSNSSAGGSHAPDPNAERGTQLDLDA